MTEQQLRIVSLIPSATEIVVSLGLGDQLVGRSHECDFPPAVQALPVCTEPKFDPVGSSGEIHRRVDDLLTSALSVYRVKTDVLEDLRPTHIITQAQCEVCAVSLADVEAAVAELTQIRPQVISLEPTRLADLWDDISRVGQALLPAETASSTQAVIEALQARVKVCAERGSIGLRPDRPWPVWNGLIPSWRRGTGYQNWWSWQGELRCSGNLANIPPGLPGRSC